MLSLLARRRRRPAPAVLQNARLWLENLEARDCPSAPQITSFAAAVQPGHMAQLSGTVIADNLGSVSVSFSGAASGTTACDATGHFSYNSGTASLGNVTAVAQDTQQSPAVSAVISVPAPTLSALTITYGSQRAVTISGRVTDIDSGLGVAFTGAATATVSTKPDGTFSFTTSSASLGTVQAQVTDLWSQRSSLVQAAIVNAAPQITNFTASHGPNNIITFRGNVVDESPAGLVVQFAGVPSVNGKTAVVASDGTFALTVQLQPGEKGDVSAQTTDWWGASSNVAWVLVAYTAQASGGTGGGPS